MKTRIDRIRDALEGALDVQQLEIVDESHKHVGHAGAADGRGHFRLIIEASEFQGLSPIKRHRLVYSALGELMTTDIHALSIATVSEPT